MLTKIPSTLPPGTDAVVGRTIGCALAVHRTLGPGFLEGIYHDALCVEFELARLGFEREYPVTVNYRGRPLRTHRLDLVVEGRVIVEIKAVAKLDSNHHAQLMSYLKASGLRVGLLMNFHEQLLKNGLKRIVM